MLVKFVCSFIKLKLKKSVIWTQWIILNLYFYVVSFLEVFRTIKFCKYMNVYNHFLKFLNLSYMKSPNKS